MQPLCTTYICSSSASSQPVTSQPGPTQPGPSQTCCVDGTCMIMIEPSRCCRVARSCVCIDGAQSMVPSDERSLASIAAALARRRRRSSDQLTNELRCAACCAEHAAHSPMVLIKRRSRGCFRWMFFLAIAVGGIPVSNARSCFAWVGILNQSSVCLPSIAPAEADVTAGETGVWRRAAG